MTDTRMFAGTRPARPELLVSACIMDNLQVAAVIATVSTFIDSDSYLTEREFEIFALTMLGFRRSKIADHCSIQPKTVEVHRHNILAKMTIEGDARWLWRVFGVEFGRWYGRIQALTIG